MKAGDIVRFHNPHTLQSKMDLPDWKLGLLVEYNTWEKIARILHEGKVVSVRAEYTQLAIRGKENL